MVEKRRKKEKFRKLIRFIALIAYYVFARYIPFSVGDKIRGFICKYIFKRIGKKVSIQRMAYFGWGSNVEMGSESNMGINLYVGGVGGSGGQLIMGKNAKIGRNVMIFTLRHNTNKKGIPILLPGYKSEKVVFEDYSWVSSGAIILPGVIIGEGSVVAAGAVVTKNVPPYTVVAGVPARVIRSRR